MIAAAQRPPWLPTLAIAVLTAVILYLMGRVPVCDCGTIKLWHGVVKSAENSQQITDWYTFSHIIHGFIFYGALRWLKPEWSFWQRLAAAVAIECAWEIAENTPMVIERYRAATIALDYFGDSILNSMSDVAAMTLGFWLASVLPVWATVAIGLGFEAFTLWAIRDNLFLNVLMLLSPVDAVKTWQEAGGMV